MSSGNRCICLLVTGLFLLLPGGLQAADDEFSFELDEIEKKPLEWGGYTEFKFEHLDINHGAALTELGFTGEPPTTLIASAPACRLAALM